MIKKFLKIMSLISIILLSLYFYSIHDKKVIVIPYPYEFANTSNVPITELKDVENSNVLVIGDQMGAALTPYFKDLSDELNNSLKINARIYNWSRPHEGIHRTIAKLKLLKKFPDIIIYHGASEELYEKKFEVQDLSKIVNNFTYYDNENIISLIITFPIFSKIFYEDINYVLLNEIKENKPSIDSKIKLKEKELSFFLYQYELDELYNLIKDKKSSLILSTTPINLLVSPRETCQVANTNTIIEVQQEIEDDIKNGNNKKAYKDAEALIRESNINAKSLYLFGLASKNIGDLKNARDSLSKSAIYDCENFRSNAVYNSIIKRTSEKNAIHLIDFDALLSSQLTSQDSFVDDIFPQNIYYQYFIKEIKENIKTLLSVKEHR